MVRAAAGRDGGGGGERGAQCLLMVVKKRFGTRARRGGAPRLPDPRIPSHPPRVLSKQTSLTRQHTFGGCDGMRGSGSQGAPPCGGACQIAS